MRFILLSLFVVLAACAPAQQMPVANAGVGAGYWRPISAPNVLLAVDEAQAKLEYDLSQCVCGVIPKNIPTPLMMQYNPDQARLAETARVGQCAQPNQFVVAECMRARGWEPTLCAGRTPVGIGSYCGGM